MRIGPFDPRAQIAGIRVERPVDYRRPAPRSPADAPPARIPRRDTDTLSAAAQPGYPTGSTFPEGRAP